MILTVPSEFEQQLRDVNEALLVSSLKQHELADQAHEATVALRESERRYAATADQLARELAATQRLQEMSDRLIQSGDIEGLYSHIVEAAATIMRSDMSSMQMFDSKRAALRMLAFHGFEPAFGKMFEWLDSDSKTSCGLALQGGRRVIVPDVETFAGVAGTPAETAQAALGIRASQSTPLFSRAGPILGMITTHWRTPHDPPTSDLRRMDILARQAADLIERAQAEAAMRASEVRYRRIFESAKDGILIFDAKSGRITDANTRMGELMDTDAAKLLDKELWQIGLLGDKSASEAAVRELQEKGYVHYENRPLESIRGRRVDVEVVAHVYREGQDSVIQCNIRDITERSRMESKLHEQSEALADLHRRKDEFLAMLAHELRNPLAPILNSVQLLRFQKDENRLQQQARTVIERQVTQLTRLVDDLMEVSRITTGRVQLRKECVVASGIMERAVETVRPLMEQHRHELTVSLPDEPVWLHADASRLEQVVVNLLTNAAKYTHEGGHVWLSVERVGNECVLRVRDSGVGIAPEFLPRIFDLFSQAERSLDRSQGGLGIGLALVQRLVEMHDGKVEACSVLGRGSEFVVRLPAMLHPESNPISTLIGRDTSNEPSLRILVVDDNADTVQTLALLLESAGHDVQMRQEGTKVLETALAYRPDVAFLDIGLPGLNGYELAKRIRQQPRLDDVVLVAMTGYGQSSDRKLSHDAGFDRHLVKPASFDAVQKILAFVSKKATGRSCGADEKSVL